MLYKEWVKLIEEFKESGKSQAQWCREKSLNAKAFNYQYRKYRREEKIKHMYQRTIKKLVTRGA
jgi:hypothetical protein